MIGERLESLRTRNKHFATHLMGQFGLDLSDLNDARINEIEEPRRTWLLWALHGFERAEATYSYVAQFSSRSQGRHLALDAEQGISARPLQATASKASASTSAISRTQDCSTSTSRTKIFRSSTWTR
jgi:hypothetical protein